MAIILRRSTIPMTARVRITRIALQVARYHQIRAIAAAQV